MLFMLIGIHAYSQLRYAHTSKFSKGLVEVKLKDTSVLGILCELSCIFDKNSVILRIIFDKTGWIKI